MLQITTIEQLLASYKQGQREFTGLSFDKDESLANENLSGAIFTHCFFATDFSEATLINTAFIDCNLKTSVFKKANLSNATVKNCAVCSTTFEDAITDNITFENNDYYGIVLNQKDLEKLKSK
jgi:uncharacterized protein YjbI with pentapeptide repeats